MSITILTNDISLDDITKDDIQDAPQNRKYLPLTESTAYTLLALVEPLHGYGVMQKVEAMRQGTVKIGPGTLYGACITLESEGLIVNVDESDRRKTYALTDKGKAVIKEHIRRTAIMVENGKMTQSW